MPTVLAQRELRHVSPPSWRRYTVSEFNGRLTWRWLADGEEKTGYTMFLGHADKLSGVPVIPAAFAEDEVAVEDAEAVTGLHAPVCWDKLRDLM